MKYTWLIVFVCLLSCKAQKKEQSLPEEENHDLVLIAQDAYSGIAEYEAMAIRDAKSLNKFYSQINKTRKPGLPVPTVDFSTEMVLVLCMGEQKGERPPLVSKFEDSEDNVLLTIELPDSNSANAEETQPVSYPFYVYKMPLTSKKINFKKLGW